MIPTPSSFLRAEELLSENYCSHGEFYVALHLAAMQLMRVDAFYVCLYEPEGQRLHYVYNVEGDLFDKPESFPLGQGPTSYVIRTGRPLILNRGRVPSDMVFVKFANPSTASLDAIHWPLWVKSEVPNPPDMVISVQSYEQNQYGDQEQAAVSWLVKRTESLLQSIGNSDSAADAVAKARSTGARDQAVADVAKFVEILDSIIEKANGSQPLVSEVRRQQIELIQWVSSASPVDPQMEKFLASLTQRELEVLANISRGLSNSEAAVALGISAHTVKRHLDNIYRRGVMNKRADVIEAAQKIQQLYLASSGHS